MGRWLSTIPRIALAMSLSGQAAVAGQETSPRAPAPGERIKLELTCARIPGWSECGTWSTKRREAGTFLGFAGDTVRIAPEDGDSVLAIPASSVVRAWISEGRHHQTANGAIFGMFAGGITGAAVGGIVAQPGYEGFGVMAGGGLGAAAGLIIGLVIGSSVQSENWAPGALPEPGLSATAVPPRVGPILTIRF